VKFKPEGKYETIEKPTGEWKEKRTLFGKQDEMVYKKESHWVQTGFSDSKIDGEMLAIDIADAIETLERDGYELVTITPVISGHKGWTNFGNSAAGAIHSASWGFSTTSGVVIVARLATE